MKKCTKKMHEKNVYTMHLKNYFSPRPLWRTLEVRRDVEEVRDEIKRRRRKGRTGKREGEGERKRG
jgi:hypothetical protein